MITPHLYLVDGLIVRGTPIDREEFEEMTQSRSPATSEQVVFLRDVNISGPNGPVAETAFLVLSRTSIAAVGRGHIRLMAAQEETLVASP